MLDIASELAGLIARSRTNYITYIEILLPTFSLPFTTTYVLVNVAISSTFARPRCNTPLSVKVTHIGREDHIMDLVRVS